MANKKLIRITTIPIALEKLLSGQLQFMSQYYEVIAVASQKRNLEKLAAKLKVGFFYVGLTRKITPLQDLLSLLKLSVYLIRTKPFIVHTHTPKAGIVGMMAAKIAGVPNRFHTVAGLPLLEESGTKRKILDFVEKLTYACATKVYPNSHGLRDIIIELRYCDSKKLTVLANGSSNGIDTEYYNASLFSSDTRERLKRELGISPDDFVFIFVGRIVRDKGINELVAAFEKLLPIHPNIKLLLLGNYENDLDPLDAGTEKSIVENPAIIFVDFKDDVRPYYTISDALVLPTYREGFPNVVLQAGAMGLPSVVTDINGCNEIIEEGKNGLIIPVKNTEAIFTAMRQLLTDAALFDALKANARTSIVSRFEQHIVWEAILSEYRSVDHK